MKRINLRKDIAIIIVIKVLLMIGIKITWFSDNIEPEEEIIQHMLERQHQKYP